MCQSFDNGRLADAGFADQHRIVLGAAAENLQHPLDFVGPADDRIQLTFLGQLGQIASELIECRRVALPIALTRSGLPEKRDGQLSGGQEIGAEAAENLSADPFFFSEQAQQKMFAPDMIVAEKTGFFDPVFDHLLDPGAEGNFAKGHRGAAAGQVPLDFQSDLLGRESHLFQNHQGDAVGFAKDGQDEMLGPEVVVLMTLGLLSREDDDLPTLVRESFEHPASLLVGSY